MRFASSGPGKKKQRTIGSWIADKSEFEEDVSKRCLAHEHFFSDPFHKLLLLHMAS